MNEEYGSIGPNDCLVTDNIISSARNLIEGFPLSPVNFADLCELIEMTVIHERIIMTMPAFKDSPLEELVNHGIVTSTMFKNATPTEETGRHLVKTIYSQCLRTIDKGSTFGRGILDATDSHETSLERALTRIEIGEMILSVKHGRRKVAPDAQNDFNRICEIYQIFKDYADAVFNAAQYFHIHAYFGTSEIAYSIEKTVKSVPLALYKELRKLQKELIDQFLINTGYKIYDIPPFALIVLSRCKSRDDIIPETLRAREEFSGFRETCSTYAAQIHKAAQQGTFAEIVDLQNGLDKAIEVLRRKVATESNDSRFVYRLWNVIKAATPWGITKNAIDSLKDYDIDRQHLQDINGLMDIWKKLRKGSSYEAILRSALFEKEFKEEDFAAFSTYLGHVRQYMPVGIHFEQQSGNNL